MVILGNSMLLVSGVDVAIYLQGDFSQIFQDGHRHVSQYFSAPHVLHLVSKVTMEHHMLCLVLSPCSQRTLLAILVQMEVKPMFLFA
jgi:hypothetical protein